MNEKYEWKIWMKNISHLEKAIFSFKLPVVPSPEKDVFFPHTISWFCYRLDRNMTARTGDGKPYEQEYELDL